MLKPEERRSERVRGKRIVWMPMVLMILFGSMIAMKPAFAQVLSSDAGIFLSTTEIFPWTHPPKNAGATFTAQVRITNVTQCYLIVFSLTWDDTVLNLTNVAVGNCLEGTGITTQWLIGSLPPSAGGDPANPNDYLGGATYARMYNVQGVTISQPASGLVATLTFMLLVSTPTGASPISFVDTEDYPTGWITSPAHTPPPPTSQEYDFGNLDGLIFELQYPAPYPPTASFTWAPPMPYAGSTVTFTAGSAGCEGFDGDDLCPITTWEWDWDDDHIYDESHGVPTATHAFSPDGTYTVNLKVTAPGIGPFIDPSYVDNDEVSHDITVLPPIVGRNIDLTTENTRSAYRADPTCPGWNKMVITPFIGEGPNQPADAFGPQENVTLYANVTYNNCPVANKPVDFEIISPTGEWIIFRQARTDINGIATVTFRIPWPEVNAERIFGIWTAYALCDIADFKVQDTLTFRVGWIISSTADPMIDKPIPLSYQRGVDSMTVTLTVTNIGFIPRACVITVTLYDELGFVIGWSSIAAVIPPGTTVNYAMTIPIPRYAVGGIGTLYVNYYGALPTDCGVSYGPEEWLNFQVSCC